MGILDWLARRFGHPSRVAPDRDVTLAELIEAHHHAERAREVANANGRNGR